jgi:hypothetical protein
MLSSLPRGSSYLRFREVKPNYTWHKSARFLTQAYFPLVFLVSFVRSIKCHTANFLVFWDVTLHRWVLLNLPFETSETTYPLTQRHAQKTRNADYAAAKTSEFASYSYDQEMQWIVQWKVTGNVYSQRKTIAMAIWQETDWVGPRVCLDSVTKKSVPLSWINFRRGAHPASCTLGKMPFTG